MLYGGGGRQVSAQTNQNGAGVVELADVAAASPYSTFGGMYAANGSAPAALAATAASTGGGGGPSAAYIADKSAKYPGQGVPGNPRPSEYHWWMPGLGWQFIAEYEQGNNLQQQYAAMNPVELDKALSQGYTHQMSPAAQAIADAQGISVQTGSQYGYQAQYPENGATAPATATTATTGTGTTPTGTATLDDINALYLKLLGRDGNPQFMQHWLDDINVRGQTIEQVEANIKLSKEYIKRQKDLADAAAAGDGDDEEEEGVDTGPATPTLVGYYWGLGSNNGWQWLEYYTGEQPPSGSYTWGLDDPLPDYPAGWENPNLTPAPVDPDPVEEEKLYTPSGNQFYQGMFTANDMLFRNGETISSGFYNNLRDQILASLAQTAADNGRTQNTAEEIALAQGGYNGYSASGMLSPSASATARSLGLY
jgi:hypothetical protein